MIGKRTKDLTGKRFGRLVAMESVGTTKHGDALWKCECRCGKVVTVHGQSLQKGDTKSCGCLKKELAILRKRKLKGESGFNKLYGSYRKRAKKLGIRWNISKEIFKSFVLGNCYYCGKPPNQITKEYRQNLSEEARKHAEFKYNGIDRVNNSYKIGYDESNIVSCCKNCNLAKHTMTLNEFYSWISRTYKNLKKKELIT